MNLDTDPEWWQEWLDRVEDGNDGGVAVSLSTDEKQAFKQYLRRMSARKSRHTLRNRKVVCKQFAEYCETRGLDLFGVTAVDVEDWMDALLDADYAPRSVRQKTYALSSLYKRWVKRGYVDVNPVEGVEDLDKLSETRIERHSEHEYLEIEEYQKMLDACEQLRDRVVLELLWETGVRVQEAVNIQIEDIDRDERSIKIETVKSGRYESSEERTVYYTRSFGRVLRDWLDRGGRNKYLGTGGADDEGHLLVTREAPRMAVNRVTEIVDERAEAAGIQEELYTDAAGRPRRRIVGHLFRKSYGVHRTKQGMPIVYLTELMGHSDIEITREHYLKFRPDDLQEAERKYAPTLPR